MLFKPLNLNTELSLIKLIPALLGFFLLANNAFADPVTIKMIKATQIEGKWSFSVTVVHPEAANDHIMNMIGIFSPEGEMLAQSVVPLPSIGQKHVTFMVENITLSDEIEYVQVRAHCSSDGWGHDGMLIALD